MTLARFREAWERFFFAPQSPEPIAVFRILYGTCVSITLILLHSEWLDWFGVHSWVTLQTMAKVEPGVRLNLFTVMPQNDAWVAAFFWIFLGFAILLTIGLWTRVSSIVVFACLALHPAKKSLHPARRRCIFARHRIFLDVCTGRSGIVDRSAHPCSQKAGGRRD